LKRHIEIEPIKRPIKDDNRKVEEPAFVEKYLKLKKKQLKRKNREASKSINNSIIMDIMDPELRIKLETDSHDEDEFNKPKRKKMKK
jgi:hypothetical protein